jgi:hypothetical protein
MAPAEEVSLGELVPGWIPVVASIYFKPDSWRAVDRSSSDGSSSPPD